MMNNVEQVIETASDAGAAPVAQLELGAGEVWIVAKEHTWDHEDGDALTLAYLRPHEFGRKTYPNFEAASKFIREGDWPRWWRCVSTTSAELTLHAQAEKERRIDCT